jgi:hypothetical protein
LFAPLEAGLICGPGHAFAVDMGLLKQPVPFDKVVATSMNCAAERGFAQL